MENSTQPTGMESPHGASQLWSVLFVTAAAMVAAGAFSLLPVVRISPISLPEEARVALVVLIMALGFFGGAREHIVESARHIEVDCGGVVCDGTFMFRVRCTAGLVCRQWSE